jgi:hypothetical protein
LILGLVESLTDRAIQLLFVCHESTSVKVVQLDKTLRIDQELCSLNVSVNDGTSRGVVNRSDTAGCI